MSSSVKVTESIFQQTKPKKHRDEIHQMVLNVTKKFLDSHPTFEEITCPFCHASGGETAFSIETVIYKRCTICASIYNSPRPTVEALNRFYAMQPAEVVDTGLLPEMRQRRIELVMKPRWMLLKNKLEQAGARFPSKRIMEVGAGIGHFIEVMQHSEAAQEYIAVEPAHACKEALNQLPCTTVVTETLESIPEYHEMCDLIFINSVIEHPHSLDIFFEKVSALLVPNGFVSLVDMHSGGLDIEVLRGDAQNVNPFLILQIGSLRGIRILSERHGLSLVDVFSMGSMDMDILYDFSSHLPSEHPLFGFKYLLEKPELRRDLQAVLQQHLATGYNGYILKKI